MKSVLAVLALCACAPIAVAQQHDSRVGPSDPAARVPQVKYESPFSSYTPHREQSVEDWRALNEEVAKAGGHVGMFGGGGHSGQGGTKTAPMKPAAAGSPPDKKEKPAGAVQSAPQSPQGGHKGH